MRRPCAALASLGLAGASGGGKADPPDVLAAILGAHAEWLASVVANRPTFRSFPYRLSDACFYPASTVKLPAGVLVLEKPNDLAVPPDARYRAPDQEERPGAPRREA